MKKTKIALENLKPTFPFSYHIETELPMLANSVKKIGVLEPVTVTEREGKPLPVHGHRRIWAARQAGLREIPAFLIPEKNLETAFLEGLHLNLTSGEISPVEKLLAYRIARQHFSENTACETEELLEISHLPGKDSLVRKLTALPGPLVRYLHHIGIHYRMLEKILRYPFPEYRQWMEWAAETRLKSAELATLLEQVRDICLRDDCTPSDVWEDLAITEIQTSRRTPQQKIQEIKRLINEKRFPLLTRIRQNLQEMSRRMERPWSGFLQISWDSSLERPGVVLSFRIPDRDTLKRVAEALRNKDFHQQVGDLLDAMERLPEDLGE